MKWKVKKIATGILCGVLSIIAAPGAFGEDKKPLADRHKDLGLACDSCHGSGPKKAVTAEQCIGCHESYAKVAERTIDLEPNPHDNHLIDLECTKCHLGHKPQVNYCRTCHADMEFIKK
jgi:hypothetical protein